MGNRINFSVSNHWRERVETALNEWKQERFGYSDKICQAIVDKWEADKLTEKETIVYSGLHELPPIYVVWEYDRIRGLSLQDTETLYEALSRNMELVKTYLASLKFHTTTEMNREGYSYVCKECTFRTENIDEYRLHVQNEHGHTASEHKTEELEQSPQSTANLQEYMFGQRESEATPEADEYPADECPLCGAYEIVEDMGRHFINAHEELGEQVPEFVKAAYRRQEEK